MKAEVRQRIEQIRQGKIPKGYKTVGGYICPETWKAVKLSELGKWKGGGTPAKGNASYWQNGTIYWISSQEVKQDTIKETTYKITEAALKESTTTLIPENSIIVVVRSGILQHSLPIAKLSIPMAINQDIKALILNDASMIDYVFEMLKCKEAFILQTYTKKGTTVESLIFDSFSNLIIPYAKESDRNTIVKILKLQNRIIALKERYLAEKLRQKQYLMQVLLTGKKRLPGFSEPWKEVKLGDIFSERTETNHPELELLAITGTKGVIPRNQLDLKDNSSEDKSKYLKICVGDIGYNTMRMWQGVSAYSNYEGIVSPAYTILKPNGRNHARFFAYLFKLPEIIFLFYRYSQGLVDDTRNLKYSNFKKIRVKCPVNEKEQMAIADILVTADQEIGLLRQALEQERRKKKALMQLLLSGIVRVKP